MFGYVKPAESELLVKDLRFYKALYCGLCDSIRREISPALSLSLSYDFVFLALVRSAVAGEGLTVLMKRCPLHPFKKRPHVSVTPSVRYCAAASLILAVGKLDDDVADADHGFLKKLGARISRFVLRRDLKRLMKKEPYCKEIADGVFADLEKLRNLEESGCGDLDRLCGCFSNIMRLIASYGVQGAEKLISEQIGGELGRIIYTLDACDDLERDEKRGAFNPLIIKYGSSAEAENHFEEIDMALGISCSRLDSAAALLDRDLPQSRIISNITSLGIPRVFRNVLIEGPSSKNKKESGRAARY